ncbi:MAG: hypothetical protein F4X76_09185 [Chloroflexi bacterium]|nr:hypothetical protein [Chloroflexota bacterium]
MRRATLAVASLALAVVAVLGVLATAPAAAQRATPLEVRVDVTPRTVTLGDRVRITVIATHTEPLLLTADPPSRGDVLQLIEALPAETVTLPDGSLRTEITFTVAAFTLGAQDAGPLRVFWLRQDGSSGEVQAIPPTFEVASALLDDSGALRPLKPQAAFGEPPPGWVRPAVVGGSLLALALLGALAARWLRRRTPAPAPPPEQLDLAPETFARRRLEALAGSGALARGDYERFYGTLSVVLRDYLEARFEFNATALTTPELDRSMGGHGVERWQARLAGGLLERCDASVYAGRHPDPGSADHDLTVAFEIIDLSRTQPPARVGAYGGPGPPARRP